MYAAWSSLVDVLTNVLFEYAGCDGESSSLEEPDKVVAHQRSHGIQAYGIFFETGVWGTTPRESGSPAQQL